MDILLKQLFADFDDIDFIEMLQFVTKDDNRHLAVTILRQRPIRLHNRLPDHSSDAVYFASPQLRGKGRGTRLSIDRMIVTKTAENFPP